MAKVTLKQIARQSGTSEATVSRVLRGQAEKFKIKPQTRKAIFSAAKELGYIFNRNLYKPKELRTKTIGLIIPDLSHYFLGQLTRTIIQKAAEDGITVIVCDSMESTEIEIKSIDNLLRLEVDGLMILPVGKEWKHIQDLTYQGNPLVVIDRIMPGIDCNCVGLDNYKGAYEAVEYLINHGHKKIACIQRLPDAWINEERVRGYKDAHKDNGLEIDETLIVGSNFGQRNGYLEVKKILQRTDVPTAIFAMSHLTSMEAYRALKDHGIKMPDEMSLIGFDDLPNSEYFSMPITTVKQPITEMSLMAINLLIEQINTKQKMDPMMIQLPTELVRRSSVKVL